MENLFERARKDSRVFSETEIPKTLIDKRRGLKGDYGSLYLLLLLYILQGMPLGLLQVIPMILSSNKVSYEKQAIFSFAAYPSIFKVLWAPIVDSKYSTKFGRRKTWIIPSQYCIGMSLIIMSMFSEELIGTKTTPPKIFWLTFTMFIVTYLSATQDTAVDAWGLTLLSKRNVHYVSSCNSVGMVVGSFISTTLFLSLESAEFCNRWLRSEPMKSGIIDIQTFIFSVGILFIISTTVIWLFKREVNALDDTNNNENSDILTSYKTLIRILKLKSVQTYAVIKLTQNIGACVFYSVFDLKLIQYGVPKEIMSLIKAPISVLNIFLPFVVVHTTKKAPLIYFYKFGIKRQIVGLFIIAFVFWTQSFKNPVDGFPVFYYILYFVLVLIFDIVNYANFMSLFAYTTTVADPNIGATYMTLFSTIAHIGMKWPLTVALALIDVLTIQVKSDSNDFYLSNSTMFESNEKGHNLSRTASFTNDSVQSRNIQYEIDGFYIIAIAVSIIGFIWFYVVKKTIWQMQSWPESKWRLT